MSSPEKSAPWFPAKRYGWGWGLPTCWQGWVVYVVWAALLIGGSRIMTPGPHFAASVVGYAAYAFALGAGLIAVCWAKGEKPRWRWGQE